MEGLEDWKSQLEQAEEYGLFFDRHTVKEMLAVIEKQQQEIIFYKRALTFSGFDVERLLKDESNITSEIESVLEQSLKEAQEEIERLKQRLEDTVAFYNSKLK